MSEAPIWFIPVVVVALIWNLMGCAAYLMDTMITAEQLAQMSEADQNLYATRPFWGVGATATAVWLGALGCVLLIMKKTWALPTLILSLIGIVVQDVWLFGMSNAAATGGTVVVALQSLVMVVGILLVVLARKANSSGWSR